VPDKVKIVKVNVDQEQQLAQQYGIYNIRPSFSSRAALFANRSSARRRKRCWLKKINSHA